MNPRTTGVLALVAILLGGFIYFYEIEGESGRQAALDEEKRIFPGLEADAVDVIQFSTLDGIEARFVRVDGRWRLSEPVDDLADTVAIDAIAGALTSLAREGSISNASLRWQGDLAPNGPPHDRLEEYGLGSDARLIRFVVAGKSYGLRVGRSTPVGGHLYVARWAAEIGAEVSSAHFPNIEISYIEGFRINSLKRNLNDLRERRILHFEAAELRTLRITWPDESPGLMADATDENQSQVEVALARDVDGQWQMGAPMRAEADQEMLRDLISNLSYLRATRFVDEHTDDAVLALADRAISFHWTQVGDHVERRMRIGGPFEGGLLVEGPNGKLFTIASGRLEDFKRRVVDYRFKSLSEFDLVDARHLLIEFEPEVGAEVEVEANLEEAGWMGSEPAINPIRASDLVRTLSSLQATDILAEEMGPEELAGLGLSPPRVRIRVGTESGDRDDSGILADVRLGRLISGRGLLAQRAGDPTVFVLAESVVQKIPISAEAFANRFEKLVPAEGSDVPAEDLEDLAIDPLEGVEIP
jgi:hypothetical protein